MPTREQDAYVYKLQLTRKFEKTPTSPSSFWLTGLGPGALFPERRFKLPEITNNYNYGPVTVNNYHSPETPPPTPPVAASIWTLENKRKALGVALGLLGLGIAIAMFAIGGGIEIDSATLKIIFG